MTKLQSTDCVHVTFITPAGDVRDITASSGDTLMEAALENHIPGIEGTCGGSCACATCHVKVADEWFERVGPPGQMEDGTLYFGAPRHRTSRLACQILLSRSLDGLKVEVATE